jgi:hypothetical protein
VGPASVHSLTPTTHTYINPPTPNQQVDYWLPDSEIKPIKFKVAVLKPDNQGQLKPLKKARGSSSICACPCMLVVPVHVRCFQLVWQQNKTRKAVLPPLLHCTALHRHSTNTPTTTQPHTQTHTGGERPPGVSDLRADEQHQVRVCSVHHAPVPRLHLAGTLLCVCVCVCWIEEMFVVYIGGWIEYAPTNCLSLSHTHIYGIPPPPLSMIYNRWRAGPLRPPRPAPSRPSPRTYVRGRQ